MKRILSLIFISILLAGFLPINVQGSECNPLHSYTAELTAPTCTEQGYTTYTCSVCGDSYTADYVDASGHTYENGFCTDCGVADWDTDGDGVLEILAIGNSFSIDALEYAYQIARDLDVDKIVIGNLYISGCTLATHANNAAGDLGEYRYYYNDSGTWTTTDNYKISTALESRSWDYVSLQQSSKYSGVESTYNEDLTDLIAYVQERSDAKLVWHMTWAYQQDSTNSAFPIYQSDQMTMYNAIVSAVKNEIVPNTDIDLIVPNGTAVQNSRTSLLGDTTTRDGYHMSRDYGQYLTGLLFIKTVTGLSVDGIAYAPSGVDAQEMVIAIESVNNAYANPFAVTESVFTGEAPEEGYILLQGELYKGAFWSPVSAEYDKLFYDRSMSHKYFATIRFTKETLPVGSIIILADGWRYRPDGWVTDTVQPEPRESITTESYVIVTEEWWKDYTIRSFNVSRTDGGSVMELSLEEKREIFRIYVPEDKHSHNYSATVTPPTCTKQGYTTYTCSVCGDSYTADYVDASGHTYENGFCTGCGAENPNPYGGKTIACIGDSITYGVGVTRDETDYVTVLARDLEMNYIRLGASGTTLCTDGHATCNIGKLTEENLAGADVVTILMGINDFVQARNVYYQLGTIDSTDTSTIYGALHMWCQRIAQLRQTDSLKDTEFLFLTPVMTSWNNSVSSVRNWDQGKTNIYGYTLRDLCNAIVQVCALYDIPVVDLNLVSGLYYNSAEDNTVSQFGGDGAHPGDVGHQMMAEAIKHALLKDNLRNDHDHSYGSWITTKYPGCEDGEEKRVCSVCTATESRALDATGHSYADGACTLCGQKDYRNVTYVAFGDSITYGVDGNYRDGPGRIMDNPYPELVGQILDFGFVNNQGVSGGTLCADSGFTNMTQQILNFNGKADVISIMLGVNDYQVRCPMGDIDSVDNKTIYGSLNLICQHLTENYPDAFIFFMTPFQYRGGDEDRGAGYNLPAVADAIKEVAAKYDIPVLDMYTYGRYEDEFSDTSLAYQDGIHPSQQHHINYTAPLITEFLTENYEGPAEDDSQGGQESDGKIVYREQALIKGYCTKAGEVVSSGVHSYFTMDAEGIETITITPPDAPAWNPYDIYYIVIVEEDGTVSCYGKLGKQEPTLIELGGKVKGTVYFNAFYDDHPEYVYVKEAVVTAHAHDYEAVVTEPTCTAQGYTTFACDCGDSYVDDYADATGHAYENGICADCGAAHPNLANYEGKVISILGDSISTFAGYIPVADGFNLEHLPRYPQDDLLTDVNETWWMQVIAGLDAKLGINDSWRGATVSGAKPVTTGTTGENAAMANLTRIQNLGANGKPDIILFYGGTNDLAHVSEIGSFDPDSAPTVADLTTKKWDNLADGYVHTLLRLRHYYPDATIVAMLPTYTRSYYTAEKLAQANAVLARICDHYGVPCVDLRDCGIAVKDLPDGIHPDANGMDFISAAVVDALLSKCEMEAGEHIVHSVTHELTGVKSSLSYYKGVSHGEPFITTITGEDVEILVTMGGVDITDTVYANGVVTIAEVTGDIEITAEGYVKPIYADHLQAMPENTCCGINLWEALEHDAQYYTVSGWGIHSSGTVYSVTFPVSAGDRVYATSCGAAGSNGSSINGIRVTWFDEDGLLKSVSADKVYEEFAEQGYLTVPEGAVAVSIPMWKVSDDNVIYLLDRTHTYENGVCAGCGAVLGDLDLDGDVDASDLTLLARHVGNIELVAGQALANADVNGDGSVDSDDLTKHARYVGNIITGWEQD